MITFVCSCIFTVLILAFVSGASLRFFRHLFGRGAVPLLHDDSCLAARAGTGGWAGGLALADPAPVVSDGDDYHSQPASGTISGRPDTTSSSGGSMTPRAVL